MKRADRWDGCSLRRSPRPMHHHPWYAASHCRPSAADVHPPPYGVGVRGGSYVYLLELRHIRRGALCSGQEAICLERLAVNLVKRWDIVIPLKQGCGWTASFNGASIQFPHRIENRMIVSIKGVLFKF